MNENEISKIQIEKETYNIKDEEARDEINKLKNKYSNIKLFYPLTNNSGSSGNGNCTIIQCKTKNIIIDFGQDTTGEKIANFLINKNITNIDYCFISHFHSDHIGGKSGIINLINNSKINFKNATFYLPPVLDTTKYHPQSTGENFNTIRNDIINELKKHNIKYLTVNNQEIINIEENVEIKTLNADNNDWNNYYNELTNTNGSNSRYLGETSSSSTNYNNFSIVYELKNINNYVLFPADIELLAQKSISKLLNAKYNIYNLEHHGANDDTNKDYFTKIIPTDFAIIMANIEDNMINETMALFKMIGIPTYSNFNQELEVDLNGYNCSINAKENVNKLSLNTYLIKHFFNLTENHIIPPNEIADSTDLNNLKEPNIYYSPNGTRSKTLKNYPPFVIDSGFELKVEHVSNINSILQTFILHTDNIIIAKRIYHDTIDNGYVWSDWIFENNLYSSIPLKENTDLNDITAVGIYYSSNATLSRSLSNTPLTGTGFRLEVKKLSNTTQTLQIIYTHGLPRKIYVREYANTSSGYQWQKWGYLELTEMS